MVKLTTRQKMGLARTVQRPVLGARHLARRGPVVLTRRGGVHWALDLREGIDFAIWLQGRFEPGTVNAYRRLLQPGATVLDVGANIGAHTLPMARAVGPAGTVVAFEPTASAFERLEANIARNPDLAPRVTAVQVMLLASDGDHLPAEVVSSWPLLPRRELHAVVPGRPQPTTGARASTLDAAVGALGLVAVDLVKLDVDGYECDVLDGAAATIARFRPPILTEVAPFVLEEAGRTIDELLDRIDALGYDLRSTDGARPFTRADAAALSRQQASANVLAVPRSLPKVQP